MTNLSSFFQRQQPSTHNFILSETNNYQNKFFHHIIIYIINTLSLFFLIHFNFFMQFSSSPLLNSNTTLYRIDLVVGSSTRMLFSSITYSSVGVAHNMFYETLYLSLTSFFRVFLFLSVLPVGLLLTICLILLFRY